MPKIFAFDTETTGLPKWGRPFDLPDQPHMVELGWIFSPTGEEEAPASRGHLYVNWGGPVPFDEKARETNGLSDDFLRDAGVGPQVVLNLALQMIQKADMILGHNIQFDLDILKIHAYKVGRIEVYDQSLAGKILYCTKKHGEPVVKIPHPSRINAYKPPKLVELHEHFFGEPHKGAHGALADIEATWRCFHGIQRWQAGPPAATPV